MFRCLLWSVLVVLVVALPSRAMAEDPPTFALTWGTTGSGNGQFYHPTSIAVDGSGSVYVGDESFRVQKFTGDGAFVTKWGGQGINDGQFGLWMFGIAIASNGNILVSDGGRIQEITNDGVFVRKWGSIGSGDGQFRYAAGVAVDAVGNVYVADGGPTQGNQRIQKFTSDGQFLMKWGSPGAGNGQFYNIRGIVVDSQGNVYASDQTASSGRIQKFSPAGQFLQTWGMTGQQYLGDASGLAIDEEDHLYVTDDAYDHVLKFTTSGALLAKWGSEGSGPGAFEGAIGVAVDLNGNIFVADTVNDRIQKFTSTGPTPVMLSSWGRIKALYR